jgi:hypothetical protein
MEVMFNDERDANDDIRKYYLITFFGFDGKYLIFGPLL